MVMAALLLATSIYAQNYTTALWSREKMDSTWNYSSGATTAIIAKYRPAVDSLSIVIGTAPQEMEKYVPESPLSNFAVDVMKSFATAYLQKSTDNAEACVDMAITNFGGIRTTLPQGDITPYDVISIFPFDNKIVILDLPGKYVRELMNSFASRGRVEAMSGVEIVIDRNTRELKKCLVCGEPIDDNRVYKVATIDFLLGGGDSVYALRYCTDKVDTGVYMRDMIIDYIKNETACGRVIEAEKDGRAVVLR